MPKRKANRQGGGDDGGGVDDLERKRLKVHCKFNLERGDQGLVTLRISSTQHIASILTKESKGSDGECYRWGERELKTHGGGYALQFLPRKRGSFSSQ